MPITDIAIILKKIITESMRSFVYRKRSANIAVKDIRVKISELKEILLPSLRRIIMGETLSNLTM